MKEFTPFIDITRNSIFECTWVKKLQEHLATRVLGNLTQENFKHH